MPDCNSCGAPLHFPADQVIVCPFCKTRNEPPPKEVPVPVQIVNQVVNVVQKPGAPVPVELRCPGCRKRLVAVRVEDIALHGCGSCGGIWVDNASARKVVALPQRVFIELATNAGKNATRRRDAAQTFSCPICPALLDRVHSSGIEIEICQEHGTWFDAYELRYLTENLLKKQQGGRKTPSGSVRCVGCSKLMAAGQANISDFGPSCDACWRSRQATLVAEGERKAAQSGAGLLGQFVVALLTDDDDHCHHH